MGLSFKEELWLALQYAFRQLVPLPEDRIPWSTQNAHLGIAPFIPFLFLAYLTRRRNTFLIRLLLLPSVVAISIHVAYGYYFTDPRFNVYNWGQSLCAASLISKSLEFAFAKDGMLKVGEMTLPPIGGIPMSDDPSEPIKKHAETKLPIPAWIYDPLEIVLSYRGIGWDFGRGVYVPPETRPLDRTGFFKATLVRFIKNFLILDLLESIVKLVPGVGSPLGGPMFFPELPWYQRYVVSTFVHICTGSFLLAGFSTAYSLCTLIGVGLLRSSPLDWPPIMDSPFGADSLNLFWAKGWHQLLRRMFIVYGGYPGAFLTGGSQVGMVFGIFLASGMFHEFSTYTMGKGLDPSITLFFLWQAFGVVFERLWRKATGYRVQGWLGLFWVYFSIMVVGQPCVNAWHIRGFGGGLVIPPIISPARQLLFPALQHILSS